MSEEQKLDTLTLRQTYIVTVREVLEEETDNKKEKFINREFMVQAELITDVETKIYQWYNLSGISFKIVSLKFSKTKDIIL
jgi:hypothetical protein